MEKLCTLLITADFLLIPSMVDILGVKVWCFQTEGESSASCITEVSFLFFNL